MNTSKKLRGTTGPVPEITRLKETWLRMAEPSRDFWRARFSGSESQAALRASLLAKLKINLTRDNQLTEFRSWDEANQQRERMAELHEQHKQELLAGGMTLEEAQAVLLTEASAWAVAAKDFTLGVKVSGEITKTTASRMDERKLILLEKKAAQADAAKQVIESKLSPEEQRQRLKEILQ